MNDRTLHMVKVNDTKLDKLQNDDKLKREKVGRSRSGTSWGERTWRGGENSNQRLEKLNGNPLLLFRK